MRCYNFKHNSENEKCNLDSKIGNTEIQSRFKESLKEKVVFLLKGTLSKIDWLTNFYELLRRSSFVFFRMPLFLYSHH